jgi:hypothetical protein
VDIEATLMTDSFPVYCLPAKDFAGHETVDRSAEEYVRDNAHINTAEGYFPQLKRPINGTFRHVSSKHLNRYLSEFDFRYSNRKIKDRIEPLR